MHTAYIALGSNVGDRADNLRRAITALHEVGAVVRVSSVYETKPVGFADQENFYNAVLVLQTTHDAQALLHALQRTETVLGRIKTIRNGPRVIDLDILLFDNQHIHTTELVVPHLRLCERAFARVPLAEVLAPEHATWVPCDQVPDISGIIQKVEELRLDV